MKVDLIIGTLPAAELANPRNVYKLSVKSEDWVGGKIVEETKSVLLHKESSAINRIKILLYWFNTVNEMFKENHGFISYQDNIIKILEKEVYISRLEFNVEKFWSDVTGRINSEGKKIYAQVTAFSVVYFDYNGVERPVGIVVDGKSFNVECHIKDLT